jgi:hypothetical protein
MSDSLASTEIISKPIDAGVRGGGAVFKRRMTMRFSLIAAILPALVVCNAATAQVSGMASPTPTMGATSPLGLALQLPFPKISESMGNHDSKIVDAGSVD